MATYVPNASDVTQPTGDKKVASAAPEFRTAKTKLVKTLSVPEAGEFPAYPALLQRALKIANFDLGGNPQTLISVGDVLDLLALNPTELVFPLDLGFIADTYVTSTYDLGGI